MYATHIPMHRRRLAAGLVGLVVLVGSAVSQQAFAQSIDYDTDDDGLIEVNSLVKLNAIRYDLDGDGMASTATDAFANYATAFPTPAPSMGCQEGTCTGYELMADLDFDTSGDGMITTADGVLSWGSGLGWEPIGTNTNRFTAEFNGNGHAISHLFINRAGTFNVGLFGSIDSGAVIRSVGLVGVDVTGDGVVGGLAGANSGGTINASYATGEVRGGNNAGGLVGINGGTGTIRASYATGEVRGDYRIGGLVGRNYRGTIRASYATGEVRGDDDVVGGLVGENFEGTIRASYATGEVSGTDNVGGLVGLTIGGTIRASYATGEVSGTDNVGGLVGLTIGGTIRASYATGVVNGGSRSNSRVGGLVGFIRGVVIDSYFDTNTSGLTGSEGRATDELQSPTIYIGIYANWNVDLDNDGGGDDPWHFGTSEQYPVLQVDFNGDGVKSWQEFGPHSRRVAVSPGVLSLMEGEAGTYTVVLLTTPTNSVTVTPMSDNPAVSVSGELTFPVQDWNVEQTVTVRAVNDDNNVNEVVSLTHTVESEDPNYASVTAPVVTVNVADPDIDYDADDDNLIEVRSLEQLNAIRYDLDGDGDVTQSNMSNYADAFPYPATSMGCLATCKGYELMADLDFDTSGDDGITTADGVLSWGSGLGWEPIGTNTNNFTAEFHGNGHTISHLFINRAGTDRVGLFGAVGPGAVIHSVGLVGVDVTGDGSVGGLAGVNSGGTINASYATGEVNGSSNNVGGLVGFNGRTGTIRASYATGEVNGSSNNVGGLVGEHRGTIRASYATGEVRGDDRIGGLVGNNGGTIRASYATGEVSGTDNVGGLVGFNDGAVVIDSYFDTDTSGLTGSEGRATDELQSPTIYTGIYANWNVDLDDADDSDPLTGGDDPWHFGTSEQYPVLQVDFNGDGVKSWQEFGPQSRPGVFVSPGVLSLMEGEVGTYTVVLLTMPTNSVTMTPMPDNPAVSVSGELTFSMQDWNAEQTVTVRAVNDDNNVNEVVSLTHTVESEDLNYALVTIPVVTVNVADSGIDYDADDDNLIEVRSLEQLNAIRYDLDGDGDVTQSNMSNYADAFPYPATSMGCLATCKGYELMADLDFDTSGDDEITTADGVLSWGSGSGWQPIGTNFNRFTAEFHGNGHTISHLFINRAGTDFVGLFGYVGSGAVIRSVGLVGVDVTGDDAVGGLVGGSNGTIRASYATGGVSGNRDVGGLVGWHSSGTIRASYATGEVRGQDSIGGLVGFNDGTIDASYATGGVSGYRDVGGLVGWNNGGAIRASYATGEVRGDSNVGGLAGANSGGTINASYATGEVNGSSNNVGGLMGFNRGTIRASYATGEVRGTDNVGGLVGFNRGTIRASYATGEVRGTDNVGGLVGSNSGGTINASYATGEVNGTDDVGGLVGRHSIGTIRASYATGVVNGGGGLVGGLVGWSIGGTIRASYATGEVNGTDDYVGGLVGFNGGMVIDSYFDTDTSGLTGSEGRATGELQSPTIYTGIYANWNVDLDDADSDSNALTGGDDPWHFGASDQYPVLQVDFDGDGVKSWQEFGPNSRRVAVSPGVLSLMEEEAGTYTVVLLTTPTDSVTVTPMSDNPAVSVSGELTFLMQDWNAEQTVTVRAVNDDNVVDEVVSLTHTVESEDLNYALVTTPVVTVNVADHGIDYDADNDNLIEVRSLEQLNAIRYDLDGIGTPTQSNMSNYADAFPYPATSMGCLATCKGYELMADLDFDISGDDEITTADGVLSWGSGLGWEPIGTDANRFTAEFHGNGHTISHLFINRAGTNHVGLFGYVGSGAVIRSVGLVGVDVTGDGSVGGLAGVNSGGTINASYATGEVNGSSNNVGGLVGFNGRTGTIRASYATGEVNGSSNNVGGLVGENRGTINASYATGEVSGNRDVGGLVGESRGTINASYATGEVRGDNRIGGLVGFNDGAIRASYATGEVNGTDDYVGGLVGFNGGMVIDSYFDTDTSGLTGSEGRATGELQSPTIYTGIYANWNVDLDDADSDSNALTGGDDPWHFGASDQYPVLQVDFDGDGVKSWQEFGPHSRRVAVSPGVLSLMEEEAGTYTVVLLTTPTDSVTVTPMSDNPAVSVSGELTFLMQDWNAEQTVTVRAVNDDNVVDEVVSLTHTVESEDLNYALVTTPVVTVNVADHGIDYDADNDNLIEVRSLEQLNAIRYDLDGIGTPTQSNMSNYADAFPYPATSMGCLATCKGYELMADLDFDTSGDDKITTADGVLSWGSGLGWEPIGTEDDRFTAEFHGNGHTISHLFINRPGTNYVGLFGDVGSGAVIHNVGLVGVDVTGDNAVGGLVGENQGTINASYATGEVNGHGYVGGLAGLNTGEIDVSYATGVVRGVGLVGGLVGFNGRTGTIRASYATGEVRGTEGVGGLVGGSNGTINASYATGEVRGTEGVGGLAGFNRGTIRASYATGEVNGGSSSIYVGGLVGWNNGGTINASYATGEVNGGGSNVGGLVGWSSGTIRASYATGEVNGGGSNVGGLVGDNNFGTIRASYATGEVRGDDQIGGLVGWNNSGTIRASYATGGVSGQNLVGGLAGLNTGEIDVSYATGWVRGDERIGRDERIGGLVGENQGTINASYATGEVNGGGSNVGGLVGWSSGTIRASYATGEVSGNSNVGGLVGFNDGVVIDSYFDTNTSGLTGSEGRTTGELQSPTTYTGIYANWNVDLDDADSDSNALTGGDDPWHFGASVQYPALQVDFDGDGVKSWQEFGPQSRPGVFVSPGVLSLIEGEAGTYTVVLLTTPTDSVTVTPMSDNPAVSVSGELTFMPANWNTIQTVTVSAVNDDNDADEVASLTHTVKSEDPNYASVTTPVVTVNVAENAIDYDADNDNLIEVRSLEQLNAIRYDLDGDGDVTQFDMSNYADAFPYPATSMGCLATCKGYELMADLDFDTSGDDKITAADGVLSWGSGLGWEPIGTNSNNFTAEFHGNDHTISHLFINRAGTDRVGLFGATGAGAVIRSVGLVGVDVTGDGVVGGLVGWNSGTIRASYATGEVRGDYRIGGLVGENSSRGTIRASYATGEVRGNRDVGGLVGINSNGTIRASYEPVGLRDNHT